MITIKKGFYQIDQEDGQFVFQYQEDRMMFHKIYCDTLKDAIALGVSLGLKPNCYIACDKISGSITHC